MRAIIKSLVPHAPAGRWIALAAAFMLLGVADFFGPGFTRIVDQRAGDLLLRMNAARRPPSDRVVIVDIDQRSLEQMNDMAGSWPWPRSVHGELIDHIARQQPRAVALDILFNEPDVYRPEHDVAFADAVARHPNVWLAMTLNADGEGGPVRRMPAAVGARPLTSPPADTRVPLMLPLVVGAHHPEAMRGGLINFAQDSDNVGRHHQLWQDRAGWRFPSLPARIMASLGRPTPPGPSILLNWRSGWRHVSYADLYLDSLRQRPARPPDELRGKIVVIGTSAPGLLDLRLTPLGSTYPGTEILATALDNLDRGDWLREVPRASPLPLALMLGLIGFVALGFARKVSAARIGWVMLALTIVVVAAAAVAVINGVFVPVFAALAFGWTCYLVTSAIAYVEERAQRLRTFGLFQRFLDPRVVADLIEQGEIGVDNTPDAREITILFSDIRGFTSLSETASPEAIVAMLNSYFSCQVDVLFRHGGTLDKFIGDAIMAFWGAPVAHADHARLAVAAALDMSAALEQWRGEVGTLGASLEIGIGVHTGRAVVGFIGSADRCDYTVIGDTVNVSSRIEGLTKGIARVLVSQATRDAAGDAFDWRDHGLHSVKGREDSIHLFEPVAKTQ